MKAIEEIWPALIIFAVVGGIGWFICWRLCAGVNKRAAEKIQEIQEAEELREANRQASMAWSRKIQQMRQIERMDKERALNAKARCLANSTRPRHSRSTLRKTR